MRIERLKSSKGSPREKTLDIATSKHRMKLLRPTSSLLNMLEWVVVFYDITGLYIRWLRVKHSFSI